MMATIRGGNKLEAALNKIAKKLRRKQTLQVGFLEGRTYPNGTSVPMVAAIQNFGAPARGIPPRPFFSNMVATKSKEWPKAIALQLKATDYDVDRTLTNVGQGIVWQLKQSIIDTYSPALSPVTLMLRKMRADNPGLVVTAKTVGIAAAKVAAGESYSGVSTKPLIDTSVLLSGADFRVK